MADQELFDRAYKQLCSQKYKRAITTFSELIASLPADSALSASAYNHRGRAYGKLVNYDAAIKDYKKAIKLTKDNVKLRAWAFYNLGYAYNNLGEYEQAITYFNKAIKLAGDDVKFLDDAKANLANSKTYLDLDKEAITYFNKAIKLAGDDVELQANAYIEMGLYYKNSGDHAAAIKEYSKAIKLAKDNVELQANAYIYRASAYSNSGKYKAAIEDYTEAIKLEPSDKDLLAKTYLARGFTYDNYGKYTAAIDDYTMVIELAKDNDKLLVLAYINRGYSYKHSRNYAAAIKDFTWVIEMTEGDVELQDTAYRNRGYSYLKLEQYKEAIKDCTRVIEMADFPTELRSLGYNNYHAWAYRNRGYSYLKLEQYKEAIKDFTWVIDMAKGDVELQATAYSNRGDTHTSLGKYHAALPDCSEAILAEYHAALDDYKKAVETGVAWVKDHELASVALAGLLQEKPHITDTKYREYERKLALGPELRKELLAFTDSIKQAPKTEKTKPIKKLDEYLKEVLPAGFSQPIYRGQNYRHWHLTPSIYRGEHDEVNLVKHFRQEARAYSDTKVFTELDYLVLMQHYGVPTRLLDWSDSPLVALYFALEVVRAVATPRVWVLDVTAEPLGGIRDQKEHEKKHEEQAEKGPVEDEYYCFNPDSNNDRIVRQKGVFVVFPRAKETKCLSEILEPRKKLLPIDIDPLSVLDLREELLQKLDFNATDIYPDLEGLAKKLQASKPRQYATITADVPPYWPWQDTPSYIHR